MSPVEADLLSAPADNLVSLHSVFTALHRKRRPLAALAAAGLFVGVLLSVAVPHPRAATTALLLQFPTGADPTRAMSTDLNLLQTRAVAAAAVKALRLHESPSAFQSQYRGTILSDAVLRITVKAPNAAEAVRRDNALSRAFLGFRKQVYEYQLSVVNGVLLRREAALKNAVASTTEAIAASSSGPLSATLPDLVTQRTAETNELAQVQSDIQSNILATATVVNGSRVVDPANAVPVSARRTLLVNAASGLVAALAIGSGAVTLLAVVTTRLRRRADVAAALRAPVLVSVGRVLQPSWLRRTESWLRRVPLVRSLAPSLASARRFQKRSDDLVLVVRHLQSLMASAASQPSALVVVPIGGVEVAAATVALLVSRLAEDGQQITLVNATGRRLAPVAARTEAEEPGEGNGSPPEAHDVASATASDAVIVVAALDPAKGAEHLREWASDTVVIVTAGRSTATTLESNATMIRAAGLHLRSVVLVGCDPDDDSLGTFDAGPQPKAELRPARAPHEVSKARSS